MTWTAERTTVNQRNQIGAESNSALGTSVAAGKLIECFDFVFGINGDVIFYRPVGHKYDTVQEENTEWIDGTVAGQMDYNGLPYILAGCMGSTNGGATNPVVHGASLTAKDWIYTPPTISPSVVPQTYTIQQGDNIRAHQISYGLFIEWGYKGTRKDFTVSGKMLGQPITDGVTLTASPVGIPIAPIVAKQFNVFFDSSSAGIGTTQLLRVLSLDYLMTGIYGPLWVLNRSTVGYTAHVDMAPKATMKLKVEADALGMALLPILQSGATYYMRVDAQGNVIDNLQTVSLGTPSAGTFTLTYKAQTTATIAFNATAAAVQSALLLLSTIPTGSVTVTGATGGPYSVNFAGALAQDTTPLTGNGASLTGGTFLITQNQTKNEFKHDMAVKLNKPASTFQDDQGVFAIEWELQIVEDPFWGASGQSQQATCTNLIAAL